MQNDIFTEYVRKYSDMVYRVAYSYTRSIPDSEDIMQDVLMKLYQSGKAFRDDEHAKAWLIRVTANRSKDVLRSQRRKHAEELDENTSQAQEESGLDEAMSALGEEYRLAVYLHYYEGYGVRDIARIMRISESNVKIRLKRARDKLKEFLTES